MNGIFDHQCSYEQAALVLLGVPWEVTVSYGDGTLEGPEWIQKASSQLDFFDLQNQDVPLRKGIHFKLLESLKKKSHQLRPLALERIENQRVIQNLEIINQGCLEMIQVVEEQTKKILDDQKLFGMVGGDHSTSEGVLKEMGRRYQGDFGLLHLDAHADMRKSYQGFKHSHASVMYNVFFQKQAPRVGVMVGLRDLSEEEFQMISSHSNIHPFFDHEIKKKLLEGRPWSQIVSSIIERLPEKLYISFDIDALSWSYAPSTGCPVPGGLSFDQVIYLLDQITQQGKEIIGFDLVEVAKPSSKDFGLWDGNVGARLIYKLCSLCLRSHLI